MVHAPELLGYEQYTPFPAACQWQSERPPPVAGAFAGLFMALGATLLAWERPAWRAVCLVLSFAGLPLSLRLILLTASAYVSHPRKEDRPWRAAQRVCLGATGPILAKGHAKTGKRRPPHFLARLSPFGLAPTVIYRAHPSLWTSEGRPALAGRSSSLPWAHRPHFGERVRQNRQTSPASFFSSPLPFWLGTYCHLQGPPKSVDFGGKNSLVGKSMRRKSSQGLSLEATHSFSGTQKS